MEGGLGTTIKLLVACARLCASGDKAESPLGAPGLLEGLSGLLCPSLFPGPESIQPGPRAGPMHATKWARKERLLVAAQHVVELSVLMMSLLAHQSIQSDDQRDP